MNVHVLFCLDPMDPRRVDPAYAAEALAAERQGFPVSRVDYEALVEERRPDRAVRKVEAGAGAAIYRGWMLRAEHYRELFDALAGKGLRLLNSPEAYLHCHHLPESYPIIEGNAPRSIWLPPDAPLDRVMDALRSFGDAPLVLKDYVKSRKHEWAEACFIARASDRDAVARVVLRFLELQGESLTGGLVFREFVDFESAGRHPRSGMPLSREHRSFWLDGRPLMSFPYWSDLGQTGDGPASGTFDAIAAKVRSRFFTMDVAKRRDGGWLIVELGDGQVSGLPDDAAAERLYRALRDFSR